MSLRGQAPVLKTPAKTPVQTPRIALIHATPVAIEPINGAFKRLWPEAKTTNLLDDSLGPDLASAGHITDKMTERFIGLARYVREHGADAILFTCSAFGTAIDAAREALDVPVLKPNEAMLEEAIAAGNRIGVIATFEPSIPSILSELAALAQARYVKLQTQVKAVPAALMALHERQLDEHDRLIVAAAAELMDCDAVVLSQFSMASAAEKIVMKPNCKVLSSPVSAVMRLREALGW